MSHEFKPYDAPHLAGVCCICGDFHSASPRCACCMLPVSQCCDHEFDRELERIKRERIAWHTCPDCGKPVLDLGDLNLSPSDMDIQDADSGNICATCGTTLAL